MKKLLFSLVFFGLLVSCQKRSSEPIVVVTIFGDNTRQTIENFGASDCWTVQNIGLWNDSTRNFAAKTLFSKEFDSDGNPLGIGLDTDFNHQIQKLIHLILVVILINGIRI